MTFKLNRKANVIELPDIKMGLSKQYMSLLQYEGGQIHNTF